MKLKYLLAVQKLQILFLWVLSSQYFGVIKLFKKPPIVMEPEDSSVTTKACQWTPSWAS